MMIHLRCAWPFQDSTMANILQVMRKGPEGSWCGSWTAPSTRCSKATDETHFHRHVREAISTLSSCASPALWAAGAVDGSSRSTDAAASSAASGTSRLGAPACPANTARASDKHRTLGAGSCSPVAGIQSAAQPHSVPSALHASSKGGEPLQTCRRHGLCSTASAELAVPTHKSHPHTSQQDSR